eukprot:scaffold1282_cov251-Pinguiococcus_pyrenoidosus.AAC.69
MLDPVVNPVEHCGLAGIRGATEADGEGREPLDRLIEDQDGSKMPERGRALADVRRPDGLRRWHTHHQRHPRRTRTFGSEADIWDLLRRNLEAIHEEHGHVLVPDAHYPLASTLERALVRIEVPLRKGSKVLRGAEARQPKQPSALLWRLASIRTRGPVGTSILARAIRSHGLQSQAWRPCIPFHIEPKPDADAVARCAREAGRSSRERHACLLQEILGLPRRPGHGYHGPKPEAELLPLLRVNVALGEQLIQIQLLVEARDHSFDGQPLGGSVLRGGLHLVRHRPRAHLQASGRTKR